MNLASHRNIICNLGFEAVQLVERKVIDGISQRYMERNEHRSILLQRNLRWRKGVTMETGKMIVRKLYRFCISIWNGLGLAGKDNYVVR